MSRAWAQPGWGSVPGGGAGPGPRSRGLWGCPGVWQGPGEARGAAELIPWVASAAPGEGAPGQQRDREVVASTRSDGCSPGPAGSEGLHQGPWGSSGPGRCRVLPLDPRQAARPWSSPPHPCPAAGRSGRDRASGVCRPPSRQPLSCGPCFPLAGRSCSPTCWPDLVLAGLGASVCSGEQSPGLRVPWG